MGAVQTFVSPTPSVISLTRDHLDPHVWLVVLLSDL